MPKRRVNFLPYDTRLRANGVKDLCGFEEIRTPTGTVAYRSAVEPNLDTEERITPPASYADISINSVQHVGTTNTSRTFVMPESAVPLEINVLPNRQDTVQALSSNTALANNTYLLTQFDDRGIFIDTVTRTLHEINTVTRFQAATALTTASASLQTAINDAGLSTPPPVTQIAAWQNRLWVLIGNSVFWSAIDNINQWEPTASSTVDPSARITTSAGSRTFTTDTLRGMAVHGDQLVLFGDNGIYDTTVLDFDIQFGFKPTNLSYQRFQGGVVSSHAGLYFLADNRVFRLSGGGLTNVSEAAHGHLETRIGENVSGNIIDNTIFWTSGDGSGMIALSLDYGTIRYITCHSGTPKFITQVSNAGLRMGDITSRMGDITSRMGDLGGEADRVAIIARHFDGTLGVIEFGHTKTPHIRMNYIENDSRQRTFIQKIDVPGYSNWRIRVKDREDNNWSEYYEPNEHNEVVILDNFNSPDIELSFNLPSSRHNMLVDNMLIEHTIIGL